MNGMPEGCDATSAAPRGALLDALIAAANALCAAHDYPGAVQALRTALAHWPGDDAGQDADHAAGQDAGHNVGQAAGQAEIRTRLDVIDRLARCAEACSAHADAVTLLRELALGYERRGDLLALAATYRRLAVAYELDGHWESALAARETAAGAFARAGDCAEAAVDRLAVAAHQRSAASYSAALETLRLATADARASDRLDLRLRVSGLRGNVLSRLGRSPEGIALVRAALAEALAGNLPDTAAELQQRLADSLEHSGDYQAATAAYGAAYQYCDSEGRDAVGQLCRACATAVLFSRGEWDRALAICDDVLAAAAAAPHSRAAATCHAGLIHALRGATRAARPHLHDASVIGAGIELTAVELLSAWGLAILDEQAGARQAAIDRVRQTLIRLRGTQERHYCVPVLQWSATFFAVNGLADDVRACADALATISEATAQPEAIAALAHARGETLLPENPGEATRELRLAAGIFAELGLKFAAAQARHRAAVAALAAGDPAGAAELLAAAHAAAVRLGARQLRASCAAALGGLGGDSPGAGVRAGTGGRAGAADRAASGLTAREIDVMVLVAAGNTSREVGLALFISPRTVEMHVQGCLLKLGCRTRAEAVKRLTALGTLAG